MPNDSYELADLYREVITLTNIRSHRDRIQGSKLYFDADATIDTKRLHVEIRSLLAIKQMAAILRRCPDAVVRGKVFVSPTGSSWLEDLSVRDSAGKISDAAYWGDPRLLA